MVFRTLSPLFRMASSNSLRAACIWLGVSWDMRSLALEELVRMDGSMLGGMTTPAGSLRGILCTWLCPSPSPDPGP